MGGFLFLYFFQIVLVLVNCFIIFRTESEIEVETLWVALLLLIPFVGLLVYFAAFISVLFESTEGKKLKNPFYRGAKK